MDISTEPHRLYSLLKGDECRGEDRALTFIDGDEKSTHWTRRELFDQAEQIGNRLSESWQIIGGGNNGLVAILLASQEQQVLHELAALSQGLIPAILTPYNRKLNRNSFLTGMATLLTQIAPAVVITDMSDELSEILEMANSEVIPAVLAPSSCALLNKGKGPFRKFAEETVFVQFSSGTTGVKKAVMVKFDAIAWQLDAYSAALCLQSSDVIVGWLPLYHDMGFITSLYLALAGGVHSVMLNPLDWVARPASYLRAVSEFGGTISWHPNFAYAFMATRVWDDELNGVDLSSLRGLVNCSEPVTALAQEQFLKRYGPYGLRPDVFFGCYAMAETTFAVTNGANTQAVGLDDIGPNGYAGVRLPAVSVGTPLDGLQLSVRDEAGIVVENRQVGELWVTGPCLADGYLDAITNQTTFVDGWYRTGDLGYQLADNFYICGRKKDLLIVAGHNVFPEDIELIVGATDGVRGGRVVAFSKFDERLQSERVVVLAENENENTDFTVDFLPALKRLSAELGLDGIRIETVPPGWLLKSSSGKISRSATAAKWLEAQAVAKVAK